MKAKIKRLWVKALRSGQYKQTENALRDKGNAFCCLGVLCNLHAQAHPKFAAKQRVPEAYDGEEAYPSERVQKWAGLDSNDPWINEMSTTLATLNDDGRSFNEIADVIEKHL